MNNLDYNENLLVTKALKVLIKQKLNWNIDHLYLKDTYLIYDLDEDDVNSFKEISYDELYKILNLEE